MAKKPKSLTNWLQTTAVRVTRVHFAFIAFYILSVIVFDSWNLYTHEATAQLWTAGGIMLAANAILWFIARMKFSTGNIYTYIIIILVGLDIAFAAYNVFWQRGLASKSVLLFAVPIITAATLRSRSLVLAAATLSAAAYSTVIVRYFFNHYGESYRVELWGTVGFYCATFFILAFLLMVIIRPREEHFN